VLAGAGHLDPSRRALRVGERELPASGRHLDRGVASRPGRVLPFIEERAAPLARARPQLHDPVGRRDHVGIVFDHEERVSPRAETMENADQAVRVARMEPDRRLVEHVERVAQAPAERVGQLDPLRFTARERLRRPVERKVVEARLAEVLEPAAQLRHDRRRHLLPDWIEVEPRHELAQLPDGHRGEIGDVLPARVDLQSLRLQPEAAARPADHLLLVPLHEEPVARLVRLLLQPVQEREDAAEAALAIEKQVLVLLLQRAPRAVERNSVLLRHGAHLRHEVGAPGVGPRIERPLEEGLPRVGDDALQREGEDVSESAALGAGAVGTVEREELGPRLGERAPARFADASVGVGGALTRGALHRHAPFPLAPGVLQRLADPHPVLGRGAGAVHQDLDRGAELRRRRLVEAKPRVGPARAGAEEAAREGPVPDRGRSLSGVRGDEDRKRHLFALRAKDRFQYRVERVARHGVAATAAPGLPDAREEKPQVVGQLGHRADRGAPGLGRASLADGERRGEPLQRVVVGAREPVEELLRVGRDALDVAALPLGVNGVEGERRLPRPAHPRDDGQGGMREGDVDVLEIVLPGAAEPDPPVGADGGAGRGRRCGRGQRGDRGRRSRGLGHATMIPRARPPITASDGW
jgi:hypothetical protein